MKKNIIPTPESLAGKLKVLNTKRKKMRSRFTVVEKGLARKTKKFAVIAKERKIIRNKLTTTEKNIYQKTKKMAVVAEKKEIVGKKLVVRAKVLRRKAKKLTTKAKKAVNTKDRLEIIAKELAKVKVKEDALLANSTARKLAVLAKKKETVRRKLVVTAQKLATTAKQKENIRLKLAITAKKLVVIAEEKEIIRRKLAVATDKLAREEKLATIGKLAGIMGHEIRNPLGIIRNSIYFLNMKFKESVDEKVKRHMDIMETEIVAADKIISDVLDFARTKPPSLATNEINSVIQEVLSTANIPKTIKVQTDLGENLPKLTIDTAQVKQVFSNLISNAIEAMPKGGELRVTTSQTDSFISIVFKDTGVGISKENIDKLFTPLFSTKTKGLGLGLAACQNIISAHKGKIEFESKEGQGTTFIIKLPIAQKVDTPAVEQSSLRGAAEQKK